MILASNPISPAYSRATDSPTSRKRPCVHFRIFALCASVTRFLPFARAYSKAYRTIRSAPKRVMIMTDSAAALGSPLRPM